MANIRVVVSGSGRMGAEVLAAVTGAPDMTPVGVIEKFAQGERIALPDGAGDLPLSAGAAELLDETKPDVIIDFTNADWTPIVADAALERGVRLVIGTTSLSEEWLGGLEQRCRERGVGAVVAARDAGRARRPAIRAERAGEGAAAGRTLGGARRCDDPQRAPAGAGGAPGGDLRRAGPDAEHPP
jgi:4-hydroxy-tetrahydrodipicolinate reductase